MGKFLWLFVLLISYKANAAPPEHTFEEDVLLTPRGKIEMSDVFAKVDYEKETIVVTANIINRKKPVEELMFGGSFSPSATAYLKPISNSKFKAFVQVRCLDYFCQNLAVGIGIRSHTSNPYAFNEKKFVVLRNDRYRDLAGLGD